MPEPLHVEPTTLCPHYDGPLPVERPAWAAPLADAKWRPDWPHPGPVHVYRDEAGNALSVENNEGDCACPAIVVLSRDDAFEEPDDQVAIAAGTYEACLAYAAAFAKGGA